MAPPPLSPSGQQEEEEAPLVAADIQGEVGYTADGSTHCVPAHSHTAASQKAYWACTAAAASGIQQSRNLV